MTDAELRRQLDEAAAFKDAEAKRIERLIQDSKDRTAGLERELAEWQSLIPFAVLEEMAERKEREAYDREREEEAAYRKKRDAEDAAREARMKSTMPFIWGIGGIVVGLYLGVALFKG